jgi:beta-N-acetylhexosaminidase
MGGVQVDRTPAFVSSTLGAVHVGAILLVGQATTGTRAVATAASRARTVAGAPAGVRAIVAADQEGGLVQHLKGPGFEPIPSASEQAQLAPSQLRTRAKEWGEDLRAASVDLDLAPVADVVPASVGTANMPIGALHRGYGSDPSSVGRHVAAFVSGMGQAGVATAVKHFPGLGKVRGNTDVTAGVVDRVTTRDDPDLAPFGAGIEAGAGFLMVSLATYSKIDPDNRAVFSETVIDGMVRKDLGFDGVVLSDDLGAAAEVKAVPPAQRALRFLRAGGDMIVTVEVSVLPAMTQTVIAAAKSSRSFRSAVDQHVLRVLTAKRAIGLLTCS